MSILLEALIVEEDLAILESLLAKSCIPLLESGVVKLATSMKLDLRDLSDCPAIASKTKAGFRPLSMIGEEGKELDGANVARWKVSVHWYSGV